MSRAKELRAAGPGVGEKARPPLGRGRRRWAASGAEAWPADTSPQPPCPHPGQLPAHLVRVSSLVMLTRHKQNYFCNADMIPPKQKWLPEEHIFMCCGRTDLPQGDSNRASRLVPIEHLCSPLWPGVSENMGECLESRKFSSNGKHGISQGCVAFSSEHSPEGGAQPAGSQPPLTAPALEPEGQGPWPAWASTSLPLPRTELARCVPRPGRRPAQRQLHCQDSPSPAPGQKPATPSQSRAVSRQELGWRPGHNTLSSRKTVVREPLKEGLGCPV